MPDATLSYLSGTTGPSARRLTSTLLALVMGLLITAGGIWNFARITIAWDQAATDASYALAAKLPPLPPGAMRCFLPQPTFTETAPRFLARLPRDVQIYAALSLNLAAAGLFHQLRISRSNPTRRMGACFALGVIPLGCCVMALPLLNGPGARFSDHIDYNLIRAAVLVLLYGAAALLARHLLKANFVTSGRPAIMRNLSVLLSRHFVPF